MKKLQQYISESFLDERLKLSNEDKKYLLKLDKEYGELFMMYRNDNKWKDTLNLKEEMDKFFKYRKKGLDYYPIFKFEKCKFKEDGILPRMTDLLKKFQQFKQCFLSKYYIDYLQYLISEIEWWIQKIDDPSLTRFGTKPSKKLYDEALKVIKKHPYKTPDKSDRDISAEEAQKRLQPVIDKLGYHWKIKLYDNMVPRMNVLPEKIMRINKDATFSEIDLDGLIQHEIKGHVGRRYYGYLTGLNLFVHGLSGRNATDEGLAVWNSLNKVKKQKPNILFNIALKTIICYHSAEMDFIELFNFVKDLCKDTEISDEQIFLILARNKREIHDTKLVGGYTHDQDYFLGYYYVNQMSDADRDNILKYNVGFDQINEIPTIKKFLELNKFPSIL